MTRLDIYEPKPAGMEKYLANYGWHFSRAMAEWAVGMMRDKKGEPVQICKLDAIKDMFSRFNIQQELIAYDAVYVCAMAMADFWGSSITTEQQLAQFVADYLGDPDGYDGMPFTRFYADVLSQGRPVLWEEML